MRSQLRAGRAVWLSGLVGLAGCHYGQLGVDPSLVSLNPHPTEIIDVSGVVAGPLRVYKLHLVYRTHSSLPSCNGIDLPDGGSFPRHLDVDLPMVLEAGELTAKVAVDRYEGACGWRLWTISAVIRDEDRALANEVVASAAEAAAGLQRPETGAPPDQMIAYCGYTTAYFSCSGASAGDKRYLPVIIDAAHRDAKFDFRLGQYPPPHGYRPPCRNPDLSVRIPPCRAEGG
jgi:hypothetical protein